MSEYIEAASDAPRTRRMAHAWLIGHCLGYADDDIGAWLLGAEVLTPWLGDVYARRVRATLAPGTPAGALARAVAADFMDRRWRPNLRKFKAVGARLLALPQVRALRADVINNSRTVF